MKYKIIIIIFFVLTAISFISCTKAYIRTNHEKPFGQVLEDLKIPPYDSVSSKIEIRLWVHGEFGLRNLYRFYLTQDSIWIAEKYIPYLFGRRGQQLVSKSFIERNKNKVLWTKKVKVLSNKWNLKWKRLMDLSIAELSGEDNYRNIVFKDKHGEGIIVVEGGTRYTIDIKYNEKNNSYEYINPDLYLEYNKNNIELKKIVEIIKIITNEI